ncbi:MAG: thymidine phosphorylase [Candidatus Dojkabacteria bacterium]|nr:MAG: thymidine phosphorylase [Candidatus Dojkabacteria bacterium]
MALYLKSNNLDVETGNELEVLLNADDARKEGINKGDIVSFSFQNDVVLYVVVEVTDSVVPEGHVGINEDIWSRYGIHQGDTITITIIDRPESLEYIKKKLLGSKLSAHELEVITQDISDRKIREVEIAYFMATFFNPGFDEEEVLATIHGMAKAGDVLDFRNVKENGNMVVDKHSIGGVAAKGITPILVPIIAAHGLVIPNTSTRAITTPAGTTDILEVIMPMTHTNEELYEIIKKTGAFMIWGGALRLSPADDVLIGVERGLHVQSFQKLLVSIIAKKVSMGITHIVIDIPYGPGTKVEKPDDVEFLSTEFKKLFAKVGIKCETYTRRVVAPDGYGIGPALEVRDILQVFERHPERPMKLEETAVDMAGVLLELTEKVPVGEGRRAALQKLDSGEAAEKFWEIAMAQGAPGKKTSEEIKIGDYEQKFMAERDGIIDFVDNKEIVKISRALGNPFIKEAGVYLHKTAGDKVEKGELLLTIYATSGERLDTGIEALNMEKLFVYKQ